MAERPGAGSVGERNRDGMNAAGKATAKLKLGYTTCK